jgi:putative transposase
MLKAIKIRLYPSQEQIQFINKQLGCCRFVYNQCLDYRKTLYEKEHISISSTDAIKHIVDLKGKFDWLKEVHSKVLQQSVRDMNQAYDNFFKLHRGYPKFKSKKENSHSCRFPNDAFIGISGNRISLIKSLKDVLFKCSRKDESYLNKNQDKIKSLTLRKNNCEQFYLSILIDDSLHHKNQKDTNNVVGIDLGVKDFVITSDGEIFNNLHFKKSESDKLKRLQRQLSRKVKDSNNRTKARIKLAKVQQKITNKKQYYLHQVSNYLIDENQIICMEDLNVKGMLRNHRLAESIQEMNFGEFKRILEYKANWYNRRIVFVDRFYPSSKTCHHCGYVNKELKLSDRQWICPQCGKIIERDYNAAMNILDEGLKIIGLSSPEFTLVDYPTMDDKEITTPLKSSGRMKQEKNVI